MKYRLSHHLFQTLVSSFCPAQNQIYLPSTYECKILYGAVIVHCLPCNSKCCHIQQLCRQCIHRLSGEADARYCQIGLCLGYIYCRQLERVYSHEKRGKGVRRKVSGETKLPGNWIDFLCDTKNKKELFAFLTSKAAGIIWPQNESVYITSGQYIESLNSNSPMSACNYDTRIVVQVLHALEQGMKSVLVLTVDKDVIVILVGVYGKLATIQPSAVICVAFGTGKNHTLYSIVNICTSLGHCKSQARPVFHASTGCDSTSFRGKGKKSAWNAWQACDEVTETFINWACNPYEVLNVDTHHFQMLERLTVLIYMSKPVSIIL